MLLKIQARILNPTASRLVRASAGSTIFQMKRLDGRCRGVAGTSFGEGEQEMPAPALERLEQPTSNTDLN